MSLWCGMLCFSLNSWASVYEGDVIVVLQPLHWCCVDCVIHHERDVREEQKYMYVARTSNNRVIMACELYCCLLSRCEALRMCRSGFPNTTKWCCDQDVEVVRSSAFDESDLVGWSLLLLAATVCSFAHMPLGISDRNSRLRMSLQALHVFAAQTWFKNIA